MAIVIEPAAVPLTVDAHGAVRVGGTRVTLETVVHTFLDGASAEEIVLQYPSLSLADVYAAITYYLQHKRQVDAYLQGRERAAVEMQARIEGVDDPVGIRARLLARQGAGS